MRLLATLMVLALAACGGQEGGDAEPMAEGTGQAEGTLEDVAGTAEGLGVSPAVQGCLDLVRQARFEEAIPACTEAVAQSPESEEAKAALEQARQGAAGAAGEAGEALGEAGSELEGAAGRLPGRD